METRAEIAWTKIILLFYPALIITSLYLTGKGMADGSSIKPRPIEWAILLGVGIGCPILHSIILRSVWKDYVSYRIVATVGAPLIVLPFFGLVIGLSIYFLLSYLLFTRCR